MKELEDKTLALEIEIEKIKSILKELLKTHTLVGNLGQPLIIKDEIKDLINSLD